MQNIGQKVQIYIKFTLFLPVPNSDGSVTKVTQQDYFKHLLEGLIPVEVLTMCSSNIKSIGKTVKRKTKSKEITTKSK